MEKIMEPSRLITKESADYNQVHTITRRYLRDLRKLLKGNQEQSSRIERMIIVDYVDNVTVYTEFEEWQIKNNINV